MGVTVRVWVWVCVCKYVQVRLVAFTLASPLASAVLVSLLLRRIMCTARILDVASVSLSYWLVLLLLLLLLPSIEQVIKRDQLLGLFSSCHVYSASSTRIHHLITLQFNANSTSTHTHTLACTFHLDLQDFVVSIVTVLFCFLAALTTS